MANISSFSLIPPWFSLKTPWFFLKTPRFSPITYFGGDGGREEEAGRRSKEEGKGTPKIQYFIESPGAPKAVFFIPELSLKLEAFKVRD